jgi:hypothetical protein
LPASTVVQPQRLYSSNSSSSFATRHTPLTNGSMSLNPKPATSSPQKEKKNPTQQAKRKKLSNALFRPIS